MDACSLSGERWTSGGCQFGEPAFEEAAFGAVVCEFPGASIGVPRLIGAPEASQQFGAGRVQVAEVVQSESIDDTQPGLGAFGFGDGDGAVQLDDR
jgi:hypothetical protein